MTTARDYLSAAELSELGLAAFGRHVYISRHATIMHPERVSLGSMVRIDAFSLISASEPVTIGSYVHIGSSVTINAVAPVVIRDFAGISAGTRIFTSDDDYSGEYLTGPTVPGELSNIRVAPVELGEHSVVGSNSVLLPGPVVEEGAVIGAQSLVKGRIPEWGIYGGIPAKFMKDRSRALLEKAAQLNPG